MGVILGWFWDGFGSDFSAVLELNLWRFGRGSGVPDPPPPQAVDELLAGAGAPLELREGSVGAVTVTVPWAALGTEPVRLRLSHLRLVLRPREWRCQPPVSPATSPRSQSPSPGLCHHPQCPATSPGHLPQLPVPPRASPRSVPCPPRRVSPPVPLTPRCPLGVSAGQPGAPGPGSPPPGGSQQGRAPPPEPPPLEGLEALALTIDTGDTGDTGGQRGDTARGGRGDLGGREGTQVSLGGDMGGGVLVWGCGGRTRPPHVPLRVPPLPQWPHVPNVPRCPPMSPVLRRLQVLLDEAELRVELPPQPGGGPGGALELHLPR